jgi:hypothetical protein
MMETDQNIPKFVRDAIDKAIKAESCLEAWGFEQDEFGQWHVKGQCVITLYRVDPDWELDIILPNGSAIGGDIPIGKLGGRTAAERQADQGGLS